MKKNVDKKIIGFDLDGVILDFSEIKRQEALQRGFKISLHETPSDIVKHLIPDGPLREIKEAIYGEGGFVRPAPLIKGADRGLKELQESGIPFILISRRKRPDVAVQTLEAHGLWPTLFNEGNAFFVGAPEDKDVVAKREGVGIFVDDEPSVLSVLTSVEKRILFDPLQAYEKHTGNYIFLTSWDELTRHLTQYAITG